MAFYGIGSRRGPRPPQYPMTAWGRPMYPQPHPSGHASNGADPPLVQATGQNPYAVPTSAPPGSFDPALKAAGENADQGYLWAGEDYALGNQQRINNLYGDPTYGTAGDLGSIQHRAQTQLDSANLSHDRNTQDLVRSFQNLALSQADQQAKAGVDQGGAVAQAAGKRAANQGQTQGRLDTDWRTLVGQIGYGRDQALGGAQQSFDRANNSASTEFQRAGVTNGLYNQQLNAEKVYAAQQAGLLPTMPSGALTHQGPANIAGVYGGRYRGRMPAPGRHF